MLNADRLTLTESTKPAGDVILGLAIAGVGEQVGGGAGFNQAALAEKRGEVRDAGRLLHVVGHHDDSVVGAQFIDQGFDSRGGSRIRARREQTGWRWRSSGKI